MARDFLGTGWSFPVDTDHRGDIEVSSEEQNIRESIRVILGTAKGERVMRPEFGCDVHDYVFAATNTRTLTMIEDAVEEALSTWEPRIEVDDVDASPDPSNPNRILIEIYYWVNETNRSGNMVYPFYLDEGEG